MTAVEAAAPVTALKATPERASPRRLHVVLDEQWQLLVLASINRLTGLTGSRCCRMARFAWLSC